MFYGVARLEVLVPQSRSLKDKRAVVQRLRDRLSGRLGLAVAEVDHRRDAIAAVQSDFGQGVEAGGVDRNSVEGGRVVHLQLVAGWGQAQV